jgi:O-antigen/teichoic acid export membrane protein
MTQTQTQIPAQPSRTSLMRDSIWASVGTTAVAKIFVMGASGLLGLFTTRLIIQHFGTAAYAQYGLLNSFPTLLPFADLGMAAVVINAVASADDVRDDTYLRNSITTAFRILICAGLVIASVGVIISLFGLWPTLLGGALTAQGASAALACLLIFSVALPMTVGQRVMVGLRRTSTQVASQAVVAPFMLACVATVVLAGLPFGDYVSVFSYLANGLVSVICLIIAGRILKPQLGRAIREIPKIKSVPGVRALNLALPMLVQMIALPVAMQTHRLLLSHLTRGPELAQYNLAAQLYGMVLQSIAAGGVALWPIYAKARARRQIRSPFKPMLLFLAAGLGVAGGLALLSSWIARFVSNGRIELPLPLVLGFVVFVAVQAAKYPLGMYMTDARGLRFQVWPILIMVPLNLALSWWLIGWLGPAGPVIASTFSVLVCQVLPSYWYVRRDLRRRTAEAAVDGQANSGPGVAGDTEAGVSM